GGVAPETEAATRRDERRLCAALRRSRRVLRERLGQGHGHVTGARCCRRKARSGANAGGLWGPKATMPITKSTERFESRRETRRCESDSGTRGVSSAGVLEA